MLITKVSEHLHQIDLEPAGIKGFVASYVLKGKNVAIVEAGPMASVQNLKRALDELGVNLEEILFVAATHIHLDHSGASGRLLKYLPNAKLIVHHRGAPHAANPEKLWAQAQEALGEVAQIYGKPEPVPEDRIIAAEDGMSFNIGDGVKLEVVETLGHASHHLSYHEKLSGGIFTGDAAGVYLSEFNLVVPTTPRPFRLDIASQSLKKLISLNPGQLYFTHFGKAPNGVDKLQSYIERLDIWADQVRKGLEKGEDIKSITSRIIKNDAAMQKSIHYLEKHPILRNTVLKESVEGIKLFVEKYRNV